MTVSVERIIRKSRRMRYCEQCNRPIEVGDPRRQRTYFYNDLDQYRSTPPAVANWHLDCPPW